MLRAPVTMPGIGCFDIAPVPADTRNAGANGGGSEALLRHELRARHAPAPHVVSKWRALLPARLHALRRIEPRAAAGSRTLRP